MEPPRFLLAIAMVALSATAGWPYDARAEGRDSATERALGTATGATRAAAFGSATATASASDSSSSDRDLAPTTEAPWNPPRPVASSEPWEMVLGFPLRVATFPLSILGRGLEGTLRYVEDASLVPRVQLLLAAIPRIGIGVTPASLGDRTGLGGAVNLDPPWLGDVVRANLSGSTRRYTRTQASVGYGPGEIAYTYDWRPRERFFDVGLETSDAVASTYAARTQRFKLGLSYPWQRHGEKPPRHQVRAWAGPREMRMSRGREKPSFDQAFPPLSGQLGVRQEHLVYGALASSDGRDGKPHWSRGWRAAVEAERFDKSVKALSIRDAHTLSPQFTRYTFEAEGGVSFMRDPRTVRLSLRAVNQAVGQGPASLLLPDLMSLGGHEGLAGFEPGRFHDVDLVVGKLSYIFPLARNFEFELHAESGGVYPELKKAQLGTFKNSYGVALRPRLDTAPLASIGVDWSAESVRFRYTFGGVE